MNGIIYGERDFSRRFFPLQANGQFIAKEVKKAGNIPC
jgi:hypothetical protein